MQKTLHIYTRVSSEIQVDRFSLPAQKKAGIDKAERLGFSYEVHEEAGRSASNDNLENRPVLSRLLDLCDEGAVKDIFVTEWDRLTRNDFSDAYIKKIFRDNDVKVHTIHREFDFNDYNDEFMSSLETAMAKRENKLRVARSKRGVVEAVKKGKWHGGFLPYGYTVDKYGVLIVDESEASVYREKIVKYCLSGIGTNIIARKLNEEGIPSKSDKIVKSGVRLKDKTTGEVKFKRKDDIIWKGNTVLNILKNPLYKGERKFLNFVIKSPALISSDLWNMIQENLKKNKIEASRNTKNFYLLKNLVICGKCGERMMGYIKPARGMRQYQCMSKKADPHPRNCGMRSINLDKLNALVWERLMYVLTDTGIARSQLKRIFSQTKIDIEEIKKEIINVKRNIKSKEDERQSLIRLAAKGLITDEDLSIQLAGIETENSDLKAKIKASENKILIANNQESAYGWIIRAEEEVKKLRGNSSDEKKQSVIKKFVKKITVNYLETEKEHVINLELKFPLFSGGISTEDILSDGTILSENYSDLDVTSDLISDVEKHIYDQSGHLEDSEKLGSKEGGSNGFDSGLDSTCNAERAIEIRRSGKMVQNQSPFVHSPQTRL